MIQQYKYVKELVRACREEQKDALIVGFGDFVTALPFEMMKWLPQMDVGMIGEAFSTWPEILEHVDDENWKKVKGLVYREGSKIKLSPMRPLIPEAKLDDEVPLPAFDLAPSTETYLLYSALPYAAECMIPQARRLDALTSYDDGYVSNVYGKNCSGTRQHSPEYVLKLMSYLRMKFAINFISFIDNDFSKSREWFMRFCDLLRASELPMIPVCWGMKAHTRTVDGYLLQKANDVKCRYIIYDSQTSNDDLLKIIDENQTRKQMTAALKATLTAGINPIMNFIIGFPNETVDHVISDTQYFIDNEIHVAPAYLHPYPGTQYFKEHREQIIERFYTLNGEKDENQALERWLLSLDDSSSHLPANLTQFDDVELVGLRHMMSTEGMRLANKHLDLERLRKFKQKSTGNDRFLKAAKT